VLPSAPSTTPLTVMAGAELDHAFRAADLPRPRREPRAITAPAWLRILLLATPVALTAVVYRPILTAYFYGDDFLNLYLIVNNDFLDFVLRPHGGHLLVARNLLFYGFHQVFGTRADLFFSAILLTHLLNVLLLYQVIRHLTHTRTLAALGAAMWGVCPVHAGTLGWYSVYGQVVVATILLFVLLQIARASGEGQPLPRHVVVTWPALFLIAAVCFGVAIGLTFVAWLAFYFLLPPSRLRLRVCLAMLVLAAALPFVYRGLLNLHEWISGPSSLVAGVNILVDGLRYYNLISVMLVYLLSYGIASLVLGFYFVAGKYPTVLPIAASAVFVLLLALVLWRAAPPVRRWLAGLLLLALGSYMVIAAGRAIFFLIPTMGYAVVQQRYHYVAPIPLAIILCLMLHHLSPRHARGITGAALLLAWGALTYRAYAHTRPFLDLHPNTRMETNMVLDEVRKQVAATPPGGDVYIRNRNFNSVGHLLVGDPVGFPGWAAVFAIYYPEHTVDGRRVYFVIDDPFVVAAVSGGHRTAGLVVGPDHVNQPRNPAPPR
jgi:hypothetical protein